MNNDRVEAEVDQPVSGATRPDRAPGSWRRLAAVAALVAMAMVGLVLVSWGAGRTTFAADGDGGADADQISGRPGLAPTEGADGPSMTSTDCTTALAASLSREMEPFDYEPSDSLSELTGWSTAIIRGQLIAAYAEADGTVLNVKVADLIGDETLIGDGSVSLWLPAGVAPEGLVEGEFVAFLTGELVEDPAGSAQVALPTFPEGFWVACDGGSAAVSVLAGPTEAGWRELLAQGPGLDDLWQQARFGADGIIESNERPTTVEDLAAVYDLRLVDGERFRLSIPEELATDMTLTQGPAPSPVTLQGPMATITIDFGFCVDEDVMVQNRLGSSVVDDGGVVRSCRADELLTMAIEPEIPLDGEALHAVDLRPIEIGARYRATLNDQWPSLRDCSNCARWGPMVYRDDNVVVNKTGRTAVSAVDLDTLATLWTYDGGVHDVALHGDGGGLSVDIVGGPFLSLDPRTGAERWRLERDENERDTELDAFGPDRWLLRSSFSVVGDDRAPLLRRLDSTTGETLWSAQGRAGTGWQWTRPHRLGDVVILMDVAGLARVPIEPPGAVLLAFDLDDGELLWTTDLLSPTEAYNSDLLAVLEVEDGPLFLAGTVDGDLVRVDPASGTILWRSAISFARFGGTDHGPDGSLAIDLVTRTGGSVLLDPDNGAIVEVRGATRAKP